jgi:hypothetical protein
MTVPPQSVTATCPGTLHFFGFANTVARVGVERHAHAARLKRALLTLGACWGIGALCVLIPIAHFVLVPSFFVLGIVLFMRKLGERASIVSVEGTCPRCKSTRPFIAGGKLKTSVKVQCPECRNELELAVDAACVNEG